MIARDGRPFGAGQRAKSLEFPLPSTTSGAIRTRAGSDAQGLFVKTPEDAKTCEVRGPLLINPESFELFVPAPQDALMLDSQHLYPLRPIRLDETTSTNLELAPVGTSRKLKGKPKGMPKYWRWKQYQQWLENDWQGIAAPQRQIDILPKDLGISGPTLETRTHVKIESSSQTAEESQLFSTSGLEFTHVPDLTASERHATLQHAQPLGLYLETNAPEEHAHNLWSLGGERRLAQWNTTNAPKPPELHDDLLEKIIKSGHCRVLLLTPAYFRDGWKPSFLLAERHRARVQLIAAAVGRPQVVSGWDYAIGGPKPSRRLAPAGSVYFLKLEGDIKNWCQQTWWHNISDEEPNFAARKDGFGLCVLGAWDGQFDTFNPQEEV
jgi:CRISPR-associated protein Cmr3